jgi:hypothetical protein
LVRLPRNVLPSIAINSPATAWRTAWVHDWKQAANSAGLIKPKTRLNVS